MISFNCRRNVSQVEKNEGEMNQTLILTRIIFAANYSYDPGTRVKVIRIEQTILGMFLIDSFEISYAIYVHKFASRYLEYSITCFKLYKIYREKRSAKNFLFNTY